MKSIGNGKHVDDTGALIYDEARPDLGWQPIASVVAGPPSVAGTTAPPPGVVGPDASTLTGKDAEVAGRVTGAFGAARNVLGQANYDRFTRTLSSFWFVLLLVYIIGGFTLDPALSLLKVCAAGRGACDEPAGSILDAPDIDAPNVDAPDPFGDDETTDTTSVNDAPEEEQGAAPTTTLPAGLDARQPAPAPALPDPAQEQALTVLPETGASPALVLGGVGLVTTGTALILWSTNA